MLTIGTFVKSAAYQDNVPTQIRLDAKNENCGIIRIRYMHLYRQLSHDQSLATPVIIASY